MKTKTINLYTIDELPPNIQTKALGELRKDWFDYGWWDCVYEDATTIGKILGIDIDHIYFTGFWSQGDGACFDGTYHYAKSATKAIRDYAPKDQTLHSIADRIQKIQAKNFYRLTASIKHHGYYHHEYCTQIEVNSGSEDDQISLTGYLREFMRWIYNRLQAEYEYQSSDESIIENCRANEYYFTDTGKLESP